MRAILDSPALAGTSPPIVKYRGNPADSVVLREVRFSFDHPGCWLQETSRDNPTTRFVLSSVYVARREVHGDLTIHAPDRATVKACVERWRRDPRVSKITLLHEGSGGHRYHIVYPAKQSIFPHILRHTPISFGVKRVEGGREHFDIVGEPRPVEDLVRVLKRLGTLEIRAMLTLNRLPGGVAAAPGAVAPMLSPKQLEAFASAVKAGYYEWPRGTSAVDIAKTMGRSHSVLLGHLRQAEAKILQDYLARLRTNEPGTYDSYFGRSEPITRQNDVPRRRKAD